LPRGIAAGDREVERAPHGGAGEGIMRVIRRLEIAVASALLAFAGLVGSSIPAHAYGGDGTLDVYQIGISFNCNNKSFCASDGMGGFWGWAELDHNPSTGANTGDAEFAFCSHGQFNGAGHQSVEVLNWWVAPGSAGPNTLFTDEEDTTTFRGQTDVETFYGQDAGIALVPGHQSTSEIFGFTPPPGVAAQIQIAYKPAH
jgi:hypothetical protein